MKHLLLFFLFSGSLDGFSQVSQFAICYHNTPACKCSSGEVGLRDTVSRRTQDTIAQVEIKRLKGCYLKDDNIRICNGSTEVELTMDEFESLKTWVIKNYPVKPDTLRATLIIYYDRGPAILHTKPGFVVSGEREVYLDDKKKVIKAPWEVFSYKLKK